MPPGSSRRTPRSHPQERPTPSPEAVAGSLAARQHGLVTRRQLLDAGVPSRRIERRVRSGRFVPAFRGVYRVGPLRSPRTSVMAAFLACGPDAVISHESAAALRDLAGSRPSGGAVHVALRRGKRRPRPGIRLHHLSTLIDTDISTVDGIPLTTAARTLLDLAPRWSARSLERAVADALDRRLTSRKALRAVLARHPGRPGTRRLVLLLGEDDPGFTRSELETAFLELVRKAQVDNPRTNVQIGGYELDFYWPDVGLAVELDGFEFHSGRTAFEGDRERDADLLARGIRVMRVTWRHLTGTPEAVLVRLGAALASGWAAWRGEGREGEGVCV